MPREQQRRPLLLLPEQRHIVTFLDREAVPHHAQWEADGIVDREIWRKAGAQGLLGLQLPEEYGGAGQDPLTYCLAVEEVAREMGVTGGFVQVNDRGALSCTLKARVETALARGTEAEK